MDITYQVEDPRQRHGPVTRRKIRDYNVTKKANSFLRIGLRDRNRKVMWWIILRARRSRPEIVYKMPLSLVILNARPRVVIAIRTHDVGPGSRQRKELPLPFDERTRIVGKELEKTTIIRSLHQQRNHLLLCGRAKIVPGNACDHSMPGAIPAVSRLLR